MTLCREYTLVKRYAGLLHLKPLTCRSWGCEWCAPDRKKRLMAQAASGGATRFITLTINPSVGSDPDERLLMLSNAWRTCVKRLRRLHGQHTIQYLAVVEATERGEPHLHILMRGPYIPQYQLSQIMGELIESPIVDIRKIRSTKEVIRYVAKYITKAPHHFGTGKRYWSSQAWELPKDPDAERDAFRAVKWVIDHRWLQNVIEWYVHVEGLLVREQTSDGATLGASPPA